jgi:hypothetical protein
MKKFIVLASLASLAACGGSKSPSPPGPILATPLAVTGQTQFGQYRPVASGVRSLEPGMANTWDLDQDFTLANGGAGQFKDALIIYLGTLPTSPPTWASVIAEFNVFPPFRGDQKINEMTWLGPVATAADGLVAAAIGDATFYAARSPSYSGPSTPLGNLYSANLFPGVDSRLAQAVDLSTAGSNIMLAWTDSVLLNSSYMAGNSLQAYQVVLRSPAGALLTSPPLFALTDGPTTGGPHTADLSAWRGQRVVLSFEASAEANPYSWGGAILDDVSISDGGHQYLRNGNFETGTLAGWTATAGDQPRNIRAGERDMAGLTVTRSFYAPPTSLWGRWTDVYENRGTSTVVTTAIYCTILGSSGGGIIYETPGSGGKAITSWDARSSSSHRWARDVGLVFGNGSVYFKTATGAVPLAPTSGDENLFTTFPLTVAPGQRATIVQFILLGSQETMATATSATAKALEIDTEAARIASSFWTDVTLRDGLTQAQLDSIRNF